MKPRCLKGRVSSRGTAFALEFSWSSSNPAHCQYLHYLFSRVRNLSVTRTSSPGSVSLTSPTLSHLPSLCPSSLHSLLLSSELRPVFSPGQHTRGIQAVSLVFPSATERFLYFNWYVTHISSQLGRVSSQWSGSVPVTFTGG